jgi:hypothetical protein
MSLTCSYINSDNKQCSRKCSGNNEYSDQESESSALHTRYCWQHAKIVKKLEKKMNEPIPSNVEIEIEKESVYVTITDKGKDKKCKTWFENAILKKYQDCRVVVCIDEFSMKYHYAMVYDNNIKYLEGPNPYYTYERPKKLTVNLSKKSQVSKKSNKNKKSKSISSKSSDSSENASSSPIKEVKILKKTSKKVKPIKQSQIVEKDVITKKSKKKDWEYHFPSENDDNSSSSSKTPKSFAISEIEEHEALDALLLLGKTVAEAEEYIEEHKVGYYKNHVFQDYVSNIYVCKEDGETISSEEYPSPCTLNVIIEQDKIRLIDSFV